MTNTKLGMVDVGESWIESNQTNCGTFMVMRQILFNDGDVVAQHST